MVSTVTEQGADATLQALRLGAIDFVAKPTGAVSLQMESFAPTFVEEIRAAAAAKVPSSKRLRERVQKRRRWRSLLRDRESSVRRRSKSTLRMKLKSSAKPSPAMASCWSERPRADHRHWRHCC